MKATASKPQSISQSIAWFADLFAILITLLGGLIGAIISYIMNGSGAGDDLIFLLIFGFVIGLVVGGIAGVFFGLLLRGFSVIVAWYEAVPPGQVYVVNSDGSAAPIVPTPCAQSGPITRAATWSCACGAQWPASCGTCESCGRHKPSSHPTFVSTQMQVPSVNSNAGTSSEDAQKQTFSIFNQMKGWMKSKQDAASTWLGNKTAPGAEHSGQSDTWTCTCGMKNHVSHGLCEQCRAAKPTWQELAAQTTDAPATKATSPHTWTCTCGAKNHVSRGTCEQCGGQKPYPRK